MSEPYDAKAMRELALDPAHIAHLQEEYDRDLLCQYDDWLFEQYADYPEEWGNAVHIDDVNRFLALRCTPRDSGSTVTP